MYNYTMVKLFVKQTKNLKERTQGLIGKNEPVALLIKTHFGIHTFGVKFPIDVLILDNENRVVSVKENLKSNRIFLWNPKYENVIELPSGTIKKNKIKIHDSITLKLE